MSLHKYLFDYYCYVCYCTKHRVLLHESGSYNHINGDISHNKKYQTNHGNSFINRGGHGKKNKYNQFTRKFDCIQMIQIILPYQYIIFNQCKITFNGHIS